MAQRRSTKKPGVDLHLTRAHLIAIVIFLLFVAYSCGAARGR